MSIDFAKKKKSCCKEDKMMVCFLPPISKSLFRKNEEVLQQEHRERRSADAQSSRFTNLTHNHTYSYSRGGKITTKHVTFKKCDNDTPMLELASKGVGRKQCTNKS